MSARAQGPRAPEEPRSKVLRMSAPLIVSFTVRSALSSIDVVYASKLDEVAAASVAAIGLTVPFEFMIIACWVGASNGLTARLAAAMGAREGERIEQLKLAAARLIVCLVGLFLLVAAAIYFLTPALMGSAAPGEEAGFDPLTAHQFRTYATVMLGGYALTAFWSVLPDSIVKAHHDTRSTMWAGLISGFTNVFLNTIFVFVFHWGIFGIALGTVLSRVAALAYALGRAASHERRRVASGEFVNPGLYERPLGAILSIAAPASVFFLLMAFEGFAVNTMLLTQPDSTTTIAAWAVFERGWRLMAMPTIATGVALLPLCATLYGAGRIGGIRRQLETAGVAAGLYSLLLVPVCWFAAPTVAYGMFTAHHPATGPVILVVRAIPIVVLVSAPLFLLRSVFEGMQMPRPSLIVSLVRSLALVVPFIWLGLRLAPSLGHSPILGALAGFILGVGTASGLLWVWMRRTLAGLRDIMPASKPAGTVP